MAQLFCLLTLLVTRRIIKSCVVSQQHHSPPRMISTTPLGTEAHPPTGSARLAIRPVQHHPMIPSALSPVECLAPILTLGRRMSWACRQAILLSARMGKQEPCRRTSRLQGLGSRWQLLLPTSSPMVGSRWQTRLPRLGSRWQPLTHTLSAMVGSRWQLLLPTSSPMVGNRGQTRLPGLGSRWQLLPPTSSPIVGKVCLVQPVEVCSCSRPTAAALSFSRWLMGMEAVIGLNLSILCLQQVKNPGSYPKKRRKLGRSGVMRIWSVERACFLSKRLFQSFKIIFVSWSVSGKCIDKTTAKEGHPLRILWMLAWSCLLLHLLCASYHLLAFLPFWAQEPQRLHPCWPQRVQVMARCGWHSRRSGSFAGMGPSHAGRVLGLGASPSTGTSTLRFRPSTTNDAVGEWSSATDAYATVAYAARASR